MKFKKLLSLLASAAMALTTLTGAITASAETDSGACGDGKWSYDSSTGKLTISGTGKMASPDVRSMPQGSANIQSNLGDHSDIYTYKKYKDEIKEVELEEGITSVGFCAFYQMPNLETVVLPSTIEEFEGPATLMSGVENSTGGSLTFDHPLMQHLCYSFAECTKLTRLTLTEGLKSIGAFAFEGCTALESVTIPSTIEVEFENNSDDIKSGKWGAYSFYNCTSLKNVTLTDGLEIIGSFAFANCGVESVVIPSSLRGWATTSSGLKTSKGSAIGIRGNGSCAFDNCNNLTSVIIEDGIERIGAAAFSNCSSLKRIAIPSTVKNLMFSFACITGLEEVYIEEGAEIPNSGNANDKFQYTFACCTNLKKLEIPAGIGIDFNNAKWNEDCTSLTDIYLHSKDYSGYIPQANQTAKYHCYDGTTTYSSLTKSGVMGFRIVYLDSDIKAAKRTLDKAVATAEKYSEEDYTAESYGALKALLDKAASFGSDSNVLAMEWTEADIYAAIDALVDKSEEPEEPSSNPSSSEPSSDNSDPSSEPSSDSSKPKTDPTTSPTKAPSTKATRSPAQVTKDKNNAQKTMNQTKITSLKAKAKGKKKIVVSWKKVTKAVGYEVQVAKNNKFKKAIVDTFTSNIKLTIADKKIKSKKTYFVRVRAYSTYKDTNNKPQKVYSKWIKKTRKVKVK